MTDPKMSDQALSQALHDIAEQRISEDMDMWPELQDKLKVSSRRTVFNSRAGRVTLALVAVLLLSVAVYAVDILTQISIDPGLEEAGVTEINETRQFENGFVTLNYAYADANRVSIAYSAEFDVPSDSVPSFRFNTTLTDDAGRTYQPIFGGGGGGGGGGTTADGATPETHVVYQNLSQSYDATIIEDHPDELNLTLELIFEEIPQMAGIPNGSGGGGGGGGNGPQPTATASEVDAPASTEVASVFEDVDPIVFEFTVPFNPGMVMTGPQTITVNDLEMTLQEAVVTASLARFELCYAQPSHEQDEQGRTQWWIPVISIHVDGEVIEAEELLTVARNAVPEAECHAYNLLQSLDEYVGEWTLSVDRLILPGSEDIELVVADLQKAGIDAEIFPGGFGIAGPTEGMSEEEVAEIVSEIQLQYYEAYPGPWEFTFDMQ